MISNLTPAQSLQQALKSSRALSRLLTARPDLTGEILTHLDTPLDAATLAALLPENLSEDTLKPALRDFKQRAWARIVTRDLAGRASLSEVTEAMTQIAEISLATALRVIMDSLIARYGQPRNAQGEAQQLIVIGMGKLGVASLMSPRIST